MGAVAKACCCGDQPGALAGVLFVARFSLSGVSKPLVAASRLPACHSSSDDRNSGANEWWEQAERQDEAVAQRWLEGWLAHRHIHAKLREGSLVAIVLLMDCIAVP